MPCGPPADLRAARRGQGRGVDQAPGGCRRHEPQPLADLALPPHLEAECPDPPAERGGPEVAAHARGRRQTFNQPLGLVLAVGPEGALDGRLALLPGGLIDEAFALGLRLVGGHVGLRGRADVELQPPAPPPAPLAAPQIERADLRQPGVEVDRRRSPPRPSSASAARCGSAAAASSARGRSAPTRPAGRSIACWKQTAETRPARKPTDRTAAGPARRPAPARLPPAQADGGRPAGGGPSSPAAVSGGTHSPGGKRRGNEGRWSSDAPCIGEASDGMTTQMRSTGARCDAPLARRSGLAPRFYLFSHSLLPPTPTPM